MLYQKAQSVGRMIRKNPKIRAQPQRARSSASVVSFMSFSRVVSFPSEGAGRRDAGGDRHLKVVNSFADACAKYGAIGVRVVYKDL